VGGCLQISDKNKLCLKNCDRRIYFLDHVTILRFLVAIIVKNNQVTGLVLKHNDSKTIKFIVRNVYFLLTLQIEPDSKELQMNLCRKSKLKKTSDSFSLDKWPNCFSLNLNPSLCSPSQRKCCRSSLGFGFSVSSY